MNSQVQMLCNAMEAFQLMGAETQTEGTVITVVPENRL